MSSPIAGPSKLARERSREVDARSAPPSAKRARSPALASTSDHKTEGKGPSESLLRRIAGPSTGKAGLSRDAAEVRSIIYEASKGSKWFENERVRDEKTEVKVRAMLASLARKLEQRGGDLSAEEREVDGLAERLESTRRTDQTVVVVDADAFYASVHELEDPSLVGKAFGVGAGVLTTASYEARRFGCRSAMAGHVAKKLCPHLITVKPDFALYTAASSKIMDILRRYDPNMSPASLDESYMNITAFLARTGREVADVVSEMRAIIKTETGLSVSAGVGPTKLIAKIAADINKPDGQCVVPHDRESAMSFMAPLSARKIYGIGRVGERYLEALEIRIVADIWTKRGALALVYGTAGFNDLIRAYLAIGSSHVEPGKRENRKSVGCEETFTAIYKYKDLDAQLREIADSLAGDMERLQYSGRTITFKYKRDTYEVRSRAHTVGPNVYMSSAADLYKYGKRLMDEAIAEGRAEFEKTGKGSRDFRLRLMGLRFTNLRDESVEAKSKRGSASSLANWAKPVDKTRKSKRDDSPVVIDLLDASDSDPDWQSFADELGQPEVLDVDASSQHDIKPVIGSSKAKLPPTAPTKLTGDDARCPVCDRTWRDGIKPAQLELHVNECLLSPAAELTDVKPAKKQKRSPSATPKNRNAFDALKHGARKASQSA